MHNQCCPSCHSHACGGGCKQQRSVVVGRVERLPAPADDGCPVTINLPDLPKPKLPDKLVVEMCDDSGNWCCFTLPTQLAATLLASGHARMKEFDTATYDDALACLRIDK